MSEEEKRPGQEQGAKPYSFRVLPHPIPRKIYVAGSELMEKSDIVFDFPSKPRPKTHDGMEREERRRTRAMMAIQEHLAQAGVNEAVGQFIEDFNRQPGDQVVLGITQSGIVLGVRQGESGPGDLSAWVIDSTLSPEQILAERTVAAHIIYDYFSDGGTINFPGDLTWQDFRDLARMPEEKRQAILLPELTSSFQLFQKISSFSIARPNHPEEPSYIHAQLLFGLKLQ